MHNEDLAYKYAIAVWETVLGADRTPLKEEEQNLIDAFLFEMKAITKNSAEKYGRKAERDKENDISKNKLDIIADLHSQGYTQREIVEILEEDYDVKISQQAVSKRLTKIKTKYPELLEDLQPDSQPDSQSLQPSLQPDKELVVQGSKSCTTCTTDSTTSTTNPTTEKVVENVENSDGSSDGSFYNRYNAYNHNVNVNDNVNISSNEDRGQIDKRFSPPSLSDINEFCLDNGFDVDANAIFDYYTANGWVQGRNKPIKDWKAAVRQWVRREGEFVKNARRASTQNCDKRHSTEVTATSWQDYKTTF